MSLVIDNLTTLGIDGLCSLALALKVLGQRGIDKIRCHVCKKFYCLSDYSHRQLINYKDSIYNGMESGSPTYAILNPP